MRSRMLWLFCIGAIATAAGSSPPAAATPAALSATASPRPSPALSSALAAAPAAPDAPAEPARGPDLVPPELGPYLDRALSGHPRIGRADARAEASRERARSAGALEDPVATLGYQNDGLSAFTLGDSEDSQIGLGFAQPIPGRGKRALRADAAAKEADALVPASQVEALALRREIVAAWWRLAFEQEARASLAEQATLADLVASLALARYQTGQAAQADVLRAQLARTRLTEGLAVSAEAVEGMRAELRGLLAAGADETLPQPGPLPDLPDPPSAEEAVARALAGSPELEGLARGAAAADARIVLARSDYRPDYVVGGTYMYRGSAFRGRFDPMVAVSVGIRLPVHRAGRLDPLLAGATADAGAARADAESLRILLATRVRQRLASIRAARASERLLRDGVIPQDRLVIDAALASYRAGGGEILAVLGGLDVLLADRLDRSRRLLTIAEEMLALETFSLDAPESLGAMTRPGGGPPSPMSSLAPASGRRGSATTSAPGGDSAGPGAGAMGGMR